MDSNIIFAFGLTLFAGLSTGIGSLVGFLSKEFNPRFLAVSLGFSAGVMIYVSLVEIFVKAKDSLSISLGDRMGYVFTVIAFLIGIAVIAIIDKLIPSYKNPHEVNVAQKIEESTNAEKNKLMRMGAFSALPIAIHNFPEGLANFMSGLSDPTFGVIFASVAGIMVCISLDELLPTAEEYGEHHFAIGGLILGMFIMALSLLFFEQSCTMNT
jgi:ZIP family zinc transporter